MPSFDVGKRLPSKFQILPRVRVLHGERIALGPGKAQLLEEVQQHGSINEASKRMKMSYMRAWLLIREMNASFKRPLVAAKRGSVKTGGGAHLTRMGLQVMALYREMNAKFLGVTQAEQRQFQKLLR